MLFETTLVLNLFFCEPELPESHRFQSLIEWNGRLDAAEARKSCIVCSAIGFRSRLSFISQSLNGVQPRSASCRKQPETESDQNGHNETKENGKRWDMDVDSRGE